MDPNFGPWMLVTRKKNPVRNGRSRFPLRSDHKSEINQKGSFVQGKETDEGVSVKPIKEKVLSNPSDRSREERNVAGQEAPQKEDLRDLVGGSSVMCPIQGEDVMRTDGKFQFGSSGTATGGSRPSGGKGAKSLKRQHPSSSSSQRASSSKSV